jgi:hypothetical protein
VQGSFHVFAGEGCSTIPVSIANHSKEGRQ